MPYIEKIAVEKARKINSTSSIYGTFAEIGAGQEVVNHFFKAGKASRTVAKSMSAYDMTFSDQIYGRAGRYVSEQRLFKMLSHEYDLLQKRLSKIRGHKTKFFAFANTVAVSTANQKSGPSHPHGWMGIRFQSEYKKAFNEIILHVNLLDKTRLQQYESLGVLGINLIYSAFYGKKDHKNIIKSLLDNLESSRIDIDVLYCKGKTFKDLNHHQLNTELIRQKSTEALLFKKSGAQNNNSHILAEDALYGKHILVQQYYSQGFDYPIEKALHYIKAKKKIKQRPVFLMNIPIQNLKKNNVSYYLKKYTSRGPDINKNQYILMSDFHKLYELKKFIRKATDQHIFILLSFKFFMSILREYSSKDASKIPFKDSSKAPENNILEFFSRLCDSKTTLMIKDYKFLPPSSPFYHLEQHLLKSQQIVPLN